jgi:hypothetical protein
VEGHVKKLIVILSAVILACSSAAKAADEFGTAAEARAMLDRAILELKADPAGAIVKFNRPDGGYRDRDLYVFCIDATTALRVAHVITESIGKDLRLTTERDGSPLGQKIFDAVHTVREGEIATVSYNWPRPGSTTPVGKESYVTRIGNFGCGVGFYK